MNKSIVSFTEELIDYAGLFPPAKLSLSLAFSNFLEYRNGNYEQMLSKFICPVNLLPQLTIIINGENSESKPIFISALSTGGNNISGFNINFENDLNIWKEFASGNTGIAEINSFEARLPEEIFRINKSKELTDQIGNISGKIINEISNPVMIFLEGSLNENRIENAESLIEAISNHNQSGLNSGFKLRTGGVEADSFPSSEHIAFCIRRCLDRKVPMKFTAGLHHPFRHFDKEIGTMMHGFINVFASGIIAMRHDISDKGIEEVLNDEDPGNFIFTDEYFSWKGWKISIGDIVIARKNLVLSFGSCSFDEPVGDLRSLNLL